jgi:hypothetical protein
MWHNLSMENITLQTAADALRAAVSYLTPVLAAKPDSITGTIRMIDSKGRHAATVTISDGRAVSVVPIMLGRQTLCGSLAQRDMRASLGM